jgi:hypothetical protein
MRHETLGVPVPPREIDRYPIDYVIDFRRIPPATLRKYLARFELDNGSTASMQLPDLAGAVAAHFHKDLVIGSDEQTLKTFCEFSFSYSGGNTLEDIKARSSRRLRSRRPKRVIGASGANLPSDVSEDEAVQSDQEPPQIVTLYCICNAPSYGEMVGCDNGPECPAGEWFHVGCVGLKEGQVPSSWFCPECEAKRVKNDGNSRKRRSGASNNAGGGSKRRNND